MAEEQPDWLEDVLAEAAEKREEAPSMAPPQVNQRENDFLNISEEEKERKFHRTNKIIIAIIILQIIALVVTILW